MFSVINFIYRVCFTPTHWSKEDSADWLLQEELNETSQTKRVVILYIFILLFTWHIHTRTIKQIDCYRTLTDKRAPRRWDRENMLQYYGLFLFSISVHIHYFVLYWKWTLSRDQFLVLRSPQLIISRLLITSWLKFSS